MSETYTDVEAYQYVLLREQISREPDTKCYSVELVAKSAGGEQRWDLGTVTSTWVYSGGHLSLDGKMKLPTARKRWRWVLGVPLVGAGEESSRTRAVAVMLHATGDIDAQEARRLADEGSVVR